VVAAATGCIAEVVFIHRHAGLEAPLLLPFLFALLSFPLTALLSSLSLVHVLLVIVGSGRIVFIAPYNPNHLVTALPILSFLDHAAVPRSQGEPRLGVFFA